MTVPRNPYKDRSEERKLIPQSQLQAVFEELVQQKHAVRRLDAQYQRMAGPPRGWWSSLFRPITIDEEIVHSLKRAHVFNKYIKALNRAAVLESQLRHNGYLECDGGGW